MKDQDRIHQLVGEIKQHNINYYQLAAPTITDEAYDQLYAELESLEAKHPDWVLPDSPTRRLQLEPATGFEKVRHLSPLMSIGNTFSYDGIVKFNNAVCDPANKSGFYAVEKKFDGMALSLLYKDGLLFRGATRGDHEEGEDVTENVRHIAGIPHKIAYMGLLDVRGEVLLPNAALAQINEVREAAGEAPFVNARNAAAGSLRLLNPAETGKRGLIFRAYAVSYATQPPNVKLQTESLAWLAEQGFPCEQPELCDGDPEAMQRAYDRLAANRAGLEYDIDGVVFKINDLARQQAAGFTARTPKAMLAYKFNQQTGETRLLGITIQVGRTGVLTPVAELEPINLGGVLVSRATLHSEDEIIRKDLRIGDTVQVRRNGDVIPGVLGVNLARRPVDSKPYRLPTTCPGCGTPVEREPGKVAIRCTAGWRCFEQRVQRNAHFASKAAMNIEGLGIKTVRDLVGSGVLYMPSGLFSIFKRDLMNIAGIGEKTADALLASIKSSRQRPLARVLMGLGIPGIGIETAKAVTRKLGSLQQVRDASAATLAAIPGVGSTAGQAIFEFMRDADNLLLLGTLALELQPVEPAKSTVLSTENPAQAGLPLLGKTFVITGALPGLSREDAKAALEAAGGTVVAGLSRKVDYLVCGDKAGSKQGKAQELGVPVVAWAQIMEMMKGS